MSKMTFSLSEMLFTDCQLFVYQCKDVTKYSRLGGVNQELKKSHSSTAPLNIGKDVSPLVSRLVTLTN